MERTQISLTQDQTRRLRRASVQRGVSMAHLVREAVDGYVPDADADRDAPVMRDRSIGAAWAYDDAFDREGFATVR